MTYANHDIYDGEWKDGGRDGKGTMKYHNGDVHEGEFRKNKMHGKGTYEYADGDVLKSIGEWKEGKKCGLAIVKSEATLDEDTDTDDAALPSKRCNVCVTP
eukprot:scaffold11656_cov85-Skeletonema_dohrnii-CCMP3373.AAC.1